MECRGVIGEQRSAQDIFFSSLFEVLAGRSIQQFLLYHWMLVAASTTTTTTIVTNKDLSTTIRSVLRLEEQAAVNRKTS
jgi:hypothetical protein